MSWIVVPTFEENGIFILSVVFLFRLSKKTEYLCSVWFFSFSQFSPVEIIIFNENFLYEFIHNAESVTRIIYAWRIIPHNQIVLNIIEAS